MTQKIISVKLFNLLNDRYGEPKSPRKVHQMLGVETPTAADDLACHIYCSYNNELDEEICALYGKDFFNSVADLLEDWFANKLTIDIYQKDLKFISDMIVRLRGVKKDMIAKQKASVRARDCDGTPRQQQLAGSNLDHACAFLGKSIADFAKHFRGSILDVETERRHWHAGPMYKAS
jgi:hypothetical protein